MNSEKPWLSHESNTWRTKFIQSLNSFSRSCKHSIQSVFPHSSPNLTSSCPQGIALLSKDALLSLDIFRQCEMWLAPLGCLLATQVSPSQSWLCPAPNPVILHHQNCLFVHYSLIYICLSCLPPSLDRCREITGIWWIEWINKQTLELSDFKPKALFLCSMRGFVSCDNSKC